MTCEYFSRVNGKISCRIYGVFEGSQDKVRECQSNPNYCFERANQSLRKEIRKNISGKVVENYVLARMFNRTIS